MVGGGHTDLTDSLDPRDDHCKHDLARPSRKKRKKEMNHAINLMKQDSTAQGNGQCQIYPTCQTPGGMQNLEVGVLQNVLNDNHKILPPQAPNFIQEQETKRLKPNAQQRTRRQVSTITNVAV